jgi:hypothetical protein
MFELIITKGLHGQRLSAAPGIDGILEAAPGIDGILEAAPGIDGILEADEPKNTVRQLNQTKNKVKTAKIQKPVCIVSGNMTPMFHPPSHSQDRTL